MLMLDGNVRAIGAPRFTGHRGATSVWIHVGMARRHPGWFRAPARCRPEAYTFRLTTFSWALQLGSPEGPLHQPVSRSAGSNRPEASVQSTYAGLCPDGSLAVMECTVEGRASYGRKWVTAREGGGVSWE